MYVRYTFRANMNSNVLCDAENFYLHYVIKPSGGWKLFIRNTRRSRFRTWEILFLIERHTAFAVRTFSKSVLFQAKPVKRNRGVVGFTWAGVPAITFMMMLFKQRINTNLRGRRTYARVIIWVQPPNRSLSTHARTRDTVPTN